MWPGVVKVASLKIKLFGEFEAWRGEDPIEGEEWGVVLDNAPFHTWSSSTSSNGG